MPLSITGRPPEHHAIRAIHAALDSGVTLIDTADVYCLDDNDIGHNERLIARALKSWSGSQEQVIVATKGGLKRPAGQWVRDARPEHLRRAFDRSLKALGVEQIALYQLHAPDPRVPFLESVGVLAELRAQGKIRWVGLSNVSVKEIQAASAVVEITAVQNRLSPFFRESLQSERGLLNPLGSKQSVVEYCGQRGIGFLAYSPLGGGRLNLRLPGNPVLQPIARRLGATAHAVALAWVMSKGPTVIPIPGARSPEHVSDAASAWKLALTPEDIQAIDAARFQTA